MYPKYFKRIFDIMGSALGLIIASPLLAVVAICLSIINRGSPFFLQNRFGKNGKIFKIIKFKTMNDERNEKGELLPDHQRIHRFGEFLRSTSIDELPQMINVLLGQMSFIGPRPLVKEDLPYNVRYGHRHAIRPGMSGWAQVNGRNMISWSQKFEYDMWYINQINLGLDIKIVWLTVLIIMNRDGINPNEEATMLPYYQQSQLKN